MPAHQHRRGGREISFGVLDLVVSIVMQVIVEGVFRRSRCRRFVSRTVVPFMTYDFRPASASTGRLVRLCLPRFIWSYLGCSSHPLRCRLLQGDNLFSRPLSSVSSNYNWTSRPLHQQSFLGSDGVSVVRRWHRASLTMRQ